jgi:hypothetical protein
VHDNVPGSSRVEFGLLSGQIRFQSLPRGIEVVLVTQLRRLRTRPQIRFYFLFPRRQILGGGSKIIPKLNALADA